MKFAQEEWQCVVGGHVKQRFFFGGEIYSSSSLENLHTCVEETLEGFVLNSIVLLLLPLSSID
jgi:hypothetical protein